MCKKVMISIQNIRRIALIFITEKYLRTLNDDKKKIPKNFAQIYALHIKNATLNCICLPLRT